MPAVQNAVKASNGLNRWAIQWPQQMEGPVVVCWVSRDVYSTHSVRNLYPRLAKRLLTIPTSAGYAGRKRSSPAKRSNSKFQGQLQCLEPRKQTKKGNSPFSPATQR